MIYGNIDGLATPVSRLVLGTNQFTLDRQDVASTVLDAFVAAGGTAIDTARVYTNGESEQVIGRWLRMRGGADGLVMVDKGAHPQVDPRAPQSGDWSPRVNPAAIASDLATSLDRLGLETIDLYLLHRDDPSVSVGPIVDTLNEHVEAGRIRAFGASNWTHKRIEQANAYAASHGLRGFVVSSPQYSLAVPVNLDLPGILSISGDSDALAWYRRTQLPIIAWSSQGGGLFSDRIAPNRLRRYDHPDNMERLRRAREVARKYGCSPVRIALAWVLAQPLDVYAVIGVSQLLHLQDSLNALDLRLTPGEIAWMNLEADDWRETGVA